MSPIHCKSNPGFFTYKIWFKKNDNVRIRVNSRQRAEKVKKGSWVEQYNKLGQYVEVLKETNLGSTVVLKTQMKGNVYRFQRIYISLGNAIQSLMSNAEDKHCVRHLYNNFKKKHIIPWWQAIMEKLKNEDLEAYKWLNTKPANNWSRSHFKEEFKCFQGAIAKARDKPILLKMIMKDLMKIIDKLKQNGGYCIATLTENMKYQVGTMSKKKFDVDLATRKCTCKKWDLCGIPCALAIAYILRKQNPYMYMDDCYKQAAYLRAYSHVITPMPTPDQWPNHVVTSTSNSPGSKKRVKSPPKRGRPWRF
ncbi:hypothetical protein D8674_012184 [Pyrus ussuriensis x Pyrus communis]|uniref:SWIM-type domain-containing protein n=1 Tax=Pyrus ussuriensis x Pyrus communis TaxID=2448454 RepID=A0A5N5G0W5_9ROSA|nr:hypothetical protein D8674_012184 [Pyrus ussuriensis x Pyrus communis]